MFGDTIFSFLFETLSGSMPDRKSHAHVPILRDPPMIPLSDGLNGGESGIRTSGTTCLTPRDGLLTVY